MMDNIFSTIISLGYEGCAIKENVFEKALSEGLSNKDFTDLVAWLSSELHFLYDLESKINPITESEDTYSFLVELSSFLKEIDCPYQCLIEGSLTSRLVNKEQRICLLYYLCGELQAARIHYKQTPCKENVNIVLSESETAKELREMLVSMNFAKPPDNITPEKLFGEIQKKITKVSQTSSPKEIIGELLFSGSLSEKQWFQIENLYKEMLEDYRTRRKLLLTRLDVTQQSFLWSNSLKESEKLTTLYESMRRKTSSEPNVHLAHILCAQKDLIITEKTSSASVRKNTKSSINEVVIGAVPDRGGRPEEQQPPPPEVPSFQKNVNPSHSNLGGGYKQQQQQHQQQQYRNPQQANPSRGYGQQNGTPQYNGNHKGGKNYADLSAPQNKNVYRDNQPRTNDVYSDPRAVGAAYTSVYYDPNYQMINPMGFGGYSQTGGNFQQYSTPQQQVEYQQYNPRPQHRGRGGYSRGRGGRGYH